MSGSPCTHYLNAEFDLALRPRPAQLHRPNLVRQVRELSTQALIGAGEGDTVLLRAEVRQDFLDHLGSCGLTPRLLQHPKIDPETRFRPFGWTAEAVELNARHDRPTEHAPLEVVRRVNARSFGKQIESELAPPRLPGRIVESVEELETFLSGREREWVVKAEFGHAGIANRRLRGPRLEPPDREFVRDRLSEDDRLVVEPWLERERDFSAVFRVPFDPARLRVHETVYTRDGAPIGAWYAPGVGELAPWYEQLAAPLETIAARLEREGYFGPVCVDAFTWRDGERTRLRPLVDLNARRAMSDGAARFRRQHAPDRHLYYRFFNRRKTTIPGSLSQTLAALGDRRYDPDRRRGILLASPLSLGIDGETRPLGKLAVMFVDEDRPSTAALEAWFRSRFEL